MLGWEQDPAPAPIERAPAVRTRLVLALLKPGSYAQVARGSAFLGTVVVLTCLLAGLAEALIWLVAAAVCLVIWQRVGAP